MVYKGLSLIPCLSHQQITFTFPGLHCPLAAPGAAGANWITALGSSAPESRLKPNPVCREALKNTKLQKVLIQGLGSSLRAPLSCWVFPLSAFDSWRSTILPAATKQISFRLHPGCKVVVKQPMPLEHVKGCCFLSIASLCNLDSMHMKPCAWPVQAGGLNISKCTQPRMCPQAVSGATHVPDPHNKDNTLAA